MNTLLDILLGTVFTFLVFSLITSWIVELISIRLNRRGKMLHSYLLRVLDDHLNINVGALLYAHPLIKQLSQKLESKGGIFQWFRQNMVGYRRRLPAYIPADQLASALIDVVASFGEQVRLRPTPTGGFEAVPTTNATESRAARFFRGVDTMKESDLKQTLLTLSQKASGRAGTQSLDQALEDVITSWYNNGMDRMAGWYKGMTTRWLLVVGFIVAVVFNVDTPRVVKTLYEKPDVRANVAKSATEFVQNNPSLQHLLPDTTLNRDTPDSVLAKREELLKTRIDSTLTAMQNLGLPVGWEREAALYQLEQKNRSAQFGESPRPTDSSFSLPLLLSLIKRFFWTHLLGWLLTAAALSFGAPFWFDLLKSIVNVRATGIKPKEASSSK